MARTAPFDAYPDRYDQWFERYPEAYRSELEAIKTLWPQNARETLEVSVGTGRFAEPLGIRYGVEPSAAMRQRAEQRGVRVVPGTGEALPFEDNRFDAVLMVTTLCFLDDPYQALREIYRVLKPGGYVVIGFVDRDSFLGRAYEVACATNPFYREATFHRTEDVLNWLQQIGFERITTVQTLFHHPTAMTVPDPVEPGYGEGAFVVIRAQKPLQRKK